MTTFSSRSFDEVDISSLAFWSNPWQERERSFAALRARDAPGTDPGFWAAVSRADVTAVSRRSNVFCTGEGVSIDDTPREILEASASFLAMDAPRHTALRQLVSSAFTPKQIARIEAQIRNQAERIVDELISTGDCDLAAVVSRRLPMWTISEMIGIEPDERANVADAANSFLAENDPIVQAGRVSVSAAVDRTSAWALLARAHTDCRHLHPVDGTGPADRGRRTAFHRRELHSRCRQPALHAESLTTGTRDIGVTWAFGRRRHGHGAPRCPQLPDTSGRRADRHRRHLCRQR